MVEQPNALARPERLDGELGDRFREHAALVSDWGQATRKLHALEREREAAVVRDRQAWAARLRRDRQAADEGEPETARADAEIAAAVRHRDALGQAAGDVLGQIHNLMRSHRAKLVESFERDRLNGWQRFTVALKAAEEALSDVQAAANGSLWAETWPANIGMVPTARIGDVPLRGANREPIEPTALLEALAGFAASGSQFGTRPEAVAAAG